MPSWGPGGGDMGLDLDLMCPHCKHSHHESSYTYNMAPIWFKAVPDAKKFVMIEGLTGAKSVPILTAAIAELRNNYDDYQPMEPDNGWGTYWGFIEFLQNLLNAANEHPDSVWEAWR